MEQTGGYIKITQFIDFLSGPALLEGSDDNRSGLLHLILKKLGKFNSHDEDSESWELVVEVALGVFVAGVLLIMMVWIVNRMMTGAMRCFRFKMRGPKVNTLFLFVRNWPEIKYSKEKE